VTFHSILDISPKEAGSFIFVLSALRNATDPAPFPADIISAVLRRSDLGSTVQNSIF
jgi:hypothetical protein